MGDGSEGSGHRWASSSGLAFVLLFGLAAALYAGGAGSSQTAISAYYADAGSWAHQIEGFAVLTGGGLAMMVYVVTLSRRLVRDGWWREVSVVSGTIGVVFLMLANTMWAATAFTVLIQGSYSVAATSHLLIEDMAFLCLVTGMAAAIPWVLIVSFSGASDGATPRWFAALGVVAAAGQLLSYWYLPLAAFLLWVIVGSLLLTVRRPRPT